MANLKKCSHYCHSSSIITINYNIQNLLVPTSYYEYKRVTFIVLQFEKVPIVLNVGLSPLWNFVFADSMLQEINKSETL